MACRLRPKRLGRILIIRLTHYPGTGLIGIGGVYRYTTHWNEASLHGSNLEIGAC